MPGYIHNDNFCVFFVSFDSNVFNEAFPIFTSSYLSILILKTRKDCPLCLARKKKKKKKRNIPDKIKYPEWYWWTLRERKKYVMERSIEKPAQQNWKLYEQVSRVTF